MKYQIITVLVGLLICVNLVRAQDCNRSVTFTVGIESGVSINRAMAAGANLGFNFRSFNIRGGFDAALTNKVNNGAVFHVQVGHTLDFTSFYITPSFGYGYVYKSADVKGINEGGLYWNVESGYKFTFKEEPLAVYAGYSQVTDVKMAMIGIRGYF